MSNVPMFLRVIAFLAYVAFVCVCLMGCGPRARYGEWETWRISGGPEELECRRVGGDPAWLQCQIPGQRKPAP